MFTAIHADEICSGALLPPDARTSGVETTRDAPLIVTDYGVS